MPEYCKECKLRKLAGGDVHGRHYCSMFMEFEKETLDNLCGGKHRK